jgi:hypothetical protein
MTQPTPTTSRGAQVKNFLDWPGWREEISGDRKAGRAAREIRIPPGIPMLTIDG